MSNVTFGVRNTNAVVVGRLSLERCRSYLADIQALMYLCDPSEEGYESLVVDNLQSIVAKIDRELEQSAEAFSFLG